ncbi:glycosyltransferase [candidate division KSB1 bacterium]|nr:glycosyltransferase [candidate division KSB1 bacterium]
MIDNYVFFSYVFAGIYLLFIKWLSSGLGKLRVGQNHDIKTVTIIVAARNEEKNLVDCLEALEKQNYPLHLIQYVLVNDRSSDATGKILSHFCEQHPNAIKIEIIDNIENRSPKKNALARGIEKAAGEILLFCDADCVPPPGWITEMVRYFESDVGLVAGFSPLNTCNNEFWPKIIELDSLVNGAVAAASFGNQIGITCTGRNLAYTRDAYQKTGGFEGLFQSLSGDDDLFLFKLQQETQKEIRYSITPESIVPAKTVSNLRGFLKQKRRHISAGKFFPVRIKTGYLIYHLINSIFYFNFCLVLLEPQFFINASGLLLTKFVFDYFYIKKFTRIMNYQAPLNYFLGWEIYYFLLNLLIGPAAFIGKIRWK